MSCEVVVSNKKLMFTALALSNIAHMRRCRELELENASLRDLVDICASSHRDSLLRLEQIERDLVAAAMAAAMEAKCHV